MEIFQATILGIVQGLTEFLPISSSAHLIMIPHIMKWEDPGLSFDVALHMGTLFAILVYFWKDWLKMLSQILGRKLSTDNVSTSDWKWIVIGTIPGAIIGFFLEKMAEDAFRAPLLIGITIAMFGGLLWYFDKNGKHTRNIHQLNLRDVLFIGSAQALAVVPGVSRSGITITAALALGLARPAAMRFSFLLSAPIIAGAGILKSRHILGSLLHGGPEAHAMAAGFVASLLSGLATVAVLTVLVRSKTFTPFVVYRVLTGTAIVVLSLMNVL